MGKQTRQQQRSYDEERAQHDDDSSSEIICHRCSMVVERLSKDLSFKCFFVLLLSLAILVFLIFSIVPIRPNNSGFDAQQLIKLSASAQAYFILEKPVSELIPRIERLEYDINAEIGVPNAKVVILSMHESGNSTAVVFGAIPDPINAAISAVSLSIMRSSLVEVFMKQTNLTLTTTVFGHPTEFEILKFQGGITVIPNSRGIWQIPQILFNFTLNNSISEILENIDELRYQLRFGLQLKSYENVFVQITNVVGSTTEAPTIIQASVVSDLGTLQPQRLRQLAETITGSLSRNLGLDNQVFGKVKSISLSSYLSGTLSSPSPSPSPGPTPALGPEILGPPPFSEISQSSPEPCPYIGSENPPSPSPTPSLYQIAPSAFSPESQRPPAVPQLAFSPHSLPADPESQWSSSFSPAPSSSSSADSLYRTLWPFGLSALIIVHLLWYCST